VYNTLMQPGDTVRPGTQKPEQSSDKSTDSAAPTPPLVAQVAQPEVPAPWQYRASDKGPAPAVTNAPHPAQPDFEPVQWQASEFVAHDKAAGWYMVLAAATLVFMGIVYLITKDKISVGMIGVISVFFGVFASRKPRVLNYALDEKGLTIAGKFYAYGDFRSFSVVSEGGLSSILFMPMKRFMPLISIYYPPEEEQLLVTVLSYSLPRENRGHDLMDRFMSKIHF